jgi:hypothetical protein
MEAVLDAPMVPRGAGELYGIRGDRGDVVAGLAGRRLAPLFAYGLDHADADEVGPLRMALAQPADVAGDLRAKETSPDVAARLDAAMVGIGGLMGGPACRGAILEPSGALFDKQIGDITTQARLVVPGLRRGRLLSASW